MPDGNEHDHGLDQARERVKRAIEESAQADEDQPTRQRNAGLAILVLALLVAGLLVAIVTGAMPHP
jgi:hypothetical protein